MIDKIIAFSIKNKLTIALFTVALIVAGIWSISKVPIDAVPDITNNQVQVITQAPNLGTVDIEQFVTYPVELAMANLPGVTEIRSVSRFGLSLVTIVFKDDMGTYLPRQLVAEKLTEVKGEIPPGFGTPTMGPISTGLGEIYQYVLEVDADFEDQYSSTELRTMQDWIIRRQMAMVPGVVEVNAFGGDIKQYEVAVNPNELKAMGIDITDILEALEANNQNTGGAYIEKNHKANYIRGEGLARSIADIEHIVVSNVNGIPITIKDVAEVRFGKAVKYGSLTKDGKGEAVGGMILMLKGGNSKEVIEAVKARMQEIEKSLPEGVKIEPFLDRSDLIAETTSTVRNNLMEGALIVIFILVFLLGNWRGGLIVASTIPLSLLFAFILMNAFGVWANLMSLGAIDFGIIVDGAVIIVEGTVFMIYSKIQKKKTLTNAERDDVAMKSSSKMMNSAFFGQLIILIVFIPILALEGVEGKMFQPMALTFMFAMIGVMILCLTYVPMMSAWFLKVTPSAKKSWGDRVVEKCERVYDRWLLVALRRSKLLVSSALVLFALAVFGFMQMGGEFIPKIDEGDIAFHSILKPGSSLSETIQTTTRIEKILIDRFPEVKHVICRIGVADVPTDPMPMDIADCFIILHPKETWTTTQDKGELVEQMKEAVSIVPGINFEFTQPIEMRFNELLTGVREDLAIKLFGEDLDVLASKAEEIGRMVAGIEGVADMKVEATSGLPQMTVNYDRRKMAQYGLNISEVNANIEAAFAGGFAGVIFEGEKRFDLVVRLQDSNRRGIDDLKNLYINTSNGMQVPLKEVADISYQPGPMQISRDNTNRRTYVGINVRGRDIKSLVTEIQAKLDAELTLPPGYYIRYGGAFENLERATNKLKVVVPIALALIFVLIFFALKSIKQTTMIYMAIPLAAIGGIFSLWMRGMPFSISAGVGFIVLFGVAVLNGLVLISSWNELKDEGVTDINERIRLGAKRRIRPIMLTALTDILGFLPMAISSSAGAEVQQPLATVVIGGMVSATLLTLFVLPILYRWMETKKQPSAGFAVKPVLAGAVILLCIGTSISAQGQAPVVSQLETAMEIGMRNNGYLRVARTNVLVHEQGTKSAVNIRKTDVGVQYGQYNSYENDFSFNISQTIAFPTLYSNQRKLADENLAESELQVSAAENTLRMNIRKSWNELSYLVEKEALLSYQDTIYSEFLRAATIRYETEATSYLELASAETKVMELKNEMLLLNSDIAIQNQHLNVLLNDSVQREFRPALFETQQLVVSTPDAIAQNPTLALAQKRIDIAEADKAVQSAKMLPDLSVGYFNQSMLGSGLENGSPATSSDRFQGVSAGITVPLFYGSYRANVKTAALQTEMAKTEAAFYQTVLEGQYAQQLQEVTKQQSSLQYYQDKALAQSDLIIENANKSFENGAIGYVEYFQNLNTGLRLKFNYLITLKGYNAALIDLEYLFGK